jgi:hypothetical protein
MRPGFHFRNLLGHTEDLIWTSPNGVAGSMAGLRIWAGE